jgi:hypothetical protein
VCAPWLLEPGRGDGGTRSQSHAERATARSTTRLICQRLPASTISLARNPLFGHAHAIDRNPIEAMTVLGATAISMARDRIVRAKSHTIQVGTIPPKTLDRPDLASQSGRNWLSAGGHSRLWLILRALKVKGSAFCLDQIRSIEEDAACRFSFAITMSIKP